MSETTIKLAAELYFHRDAMRRLWGDKYAAAITECQRYIDCAKRLHGIDDIAGTMKLVSILQEKDPAGSGLVQSLLWAAYVESVEPSA